MSESLIFFERIAHSLIFGQKTSHSFRKPMSEFPALLISLCRGNLNPDLSFNLGSGYWKKFTSERILICNTAILYTVQDVLYTLQVNICIISILKKEVVFPLITFFNCKPKQSSYGITSFKKITVIYLYNFYFI